MPLNRRQRKQLVVWGFNQPKIRVEALSTYVQWRKTK